MSEEKENTNYAAHSTPHEVLAAPTNAIKGFIAARDAKVINTSSEIPISTPSIEENKRSTRIYESKMRRSNKDSNHDARNDVEDREMDNINPFAAPAPKRMNVEREAPQSVAAHQTATATLRASPPKSDHLVNVTAAQDAALVTGGTEKASQTEHQEPDNFIDHEQYVRQQLANFSVSDRHHKALLTEIQNSRIGEKENTLALLKSNQQLIDIVKLLGDGMMALAEQVKTSTELSFVIDQKVEKVAESVMLLESRIRPARRVLPSVFVRGHVQFAGIVHRRIKDTRFIVEMVENGTGTVTLYRLDGRHLIQLLASRHPNDDSYQKARGTIYAHFEQWIRDHESFPPSEAAHQTVTSAAHYKPLPCIQNIVCDCLVHMLTEEDTYHSWRICTTRRLCQEAALAVKSELQNKPLFDMSMTKIAWTPTLKGPIPKADPEEGSESEWSDINDEELEPTSGEDNDKDKEPGEVD